MQLTIKKITGGGGSIFFDDDTFAKIDPSYHSISIKWPVGQTVKIGSRLSQSTFAASIGSVTTFTDKAQNLVEGSRFSKDGNEIYPQI
jgi:hypothetical protein